MNAIAPNCVDPIKLVAMVIGDMPDVGSFLDGSGLDANNFVKLSE